MNKTIQILKRISSKLRAYRKRRRLMTYFSSGRVAWTTGYEDHKFNEIEKMILDTERLKAFHESDLPVGYGFALDERIVEVPWIWSKLDAKPGRILDAGSSLNHPFLEKSGLPDRKEITIYTFHPESYNLIHRRVNYVFGDLRQLPFSDHHFDCVVSVSTIEHIDKDNSIYGYDSEEQAKQGAKSYEYMKALQEMIRVLAPSGVLLVTFPFGKFEDHGFFQQFDSEMVGRINQLMDSQGVVNKNFFEYKQDGWHMSNADHCKNANSYNPHTGIGKGTDGAAHSRAICCIEFRKNG